MKRLLFLAPLALAACTGSLTQAERSVLVNSALLAIDDLEAQGINYIEADIETRNRILAACTIAPIALAASADVAAAERINDACTIIRRVAE